MRRMGGLLVLMYFWRSGGGWFICFHMNVEFMKGH